MLTKRIPGARPPVLMRIRNLALDIKGQLSADEV